VSDSWQDELALADAPMPVLVQQLIPADVSAVIFSVNPVSGDRGEVVVNAAWGYGESLVGGTVPPDAYTVRRTDLAVTSRVVADKGRMTVATRAAPRGWTRPASSAITRRSATTRPSRRHGSRSRWRRRWAGRSTSSAPGSTTGSPAPVSPRRRSRSGVAKGVVMADAVQHPVVNAPIQPPPDFPVTWEDPADERLFWMLDLIHCPEPLPALSFARMRDLGLAGINAAGRGLGAPTRAVGRWINTYFYRAGVPVAGTPEELAGVERTSDQKVRAAVARLGETWEREWLPEIQRHLACRADFALASASGSQLLAHFDETVARAADRSDPFVGHRRALPGHEPLRGAVRRALRRRGRLRALPIGADARVRACDQQGAGSGGTTELAP
jgi:hypothetical protein